MYIFKRCPWNQPKIVFDAIRRAAAKAAEVKTHDPTIYWKKQFHLKKNVSSCGDHMYTHVHLTRKFTTRALPFDGKTRDQAFFASKPFFAQCHGSPVRQNNACET